MTTLVDLGPVAQLRAGRLPRRLAQMTVGLTFYGVSLGMLVAGALGTAPWDVLHTGIATHVPLTLGQVLMLASIVVLMAFWPLREVPGVATLANPVIIGLSADATIWLLVGVIDVDAAAGDGALGWAVRAGLMVGGVVLCGFASALYIGAQLGRGPRDGLMTGLSRRTGWSLRAVRTGIEVTVVLAGLALGGAAGVGTVVYALAIGPLTQAMLPRWTVRLPGAPVDPPAVEAGAGAG
ncbi:YczE/YyaS/YitT family protein [Nocardioides sp. CPCC 205120]|uniref:membrane protein YczE n=1 Tax=Nocardioides sp. CPCC 205120 TaxID=3406462 RepID=UPI003B50676E